MLDDAAFAAIRTLSLQLPTWTRWLVQATPLDFDFAAARRSPWQTVNQVLEDAEDFRELRVFGQYDYAEGAGASPLLCLRITDAAIVQIDLEATLPSAVWNSSMQEFVSTFLQVDRALRLGQPVKQLDTLSDQWRRLLDAI